VSSLVKSLFLTPHPDNKLPIVIKVTTMGTSNKNCFKEKFILGSIEAELEFYIPLFRGQNIKQNTGQFFTES
jgi:hypothetical protein